VRADGVADHAQAIASPGQFVYHLLGIGPQDTAAQKMVSIVVPLVISNPFAVNQT
jgi:hypothetical protein